MAGCDLIRDGYLADPPFVESDRKVEDGPPEPINLDVYDFLFDVEFCPDPKSCVPVGPVNIKARKITEDNPQTAYRSAVTAAALATGSNDDVLKSRATFLRNQLFHAISSRSFELCQFHKAGIIGYSATTNFVTGFLGTSLSAISAVLGGETAKTVLSTTSAVIGAGRAEFNAEIYQNLLTTAILKKIEEHRSEKLIAIQQKLSGDTDAYSVDEMLVGLNEYHYACSFMNGLVQLASDTERKVATRAEIDAEIVILEKKNKNLATELGTKHAELSKLSSDTQEKQRRALEKYVQSLELAFQQNAARITQLRAMRYTAGISTASAETEAAPDAGDGATDDGATDDGATGDGATGDDATGDGATGDAAAGDAAAGDAAATDTEATEAVTTEILPDEAVTAEEEN